MTYRLMLPSKNAMKMGESREALLRSAPPFAIEWMNGIAKRLDEFKFKAKRPCEKYFSVQYKPAHQGRWVWIILIDGEREYRVGPDPLFCAMFLIAKSQFVNTGGGFFIHQCGDKKAGKVGVSEMQAMIETDPTISRVIMWARNTKVYKSLIDEMSRLGLDVLQ